MQHCAGEIEYRLLGRGGPLRQRVRRAVEQDLRTYCLAECGRCHSFANGGCALAECREYQRAAVLLDQPPRLGSLQHAIEGWEPRFILSHDALTLLVFGCWTL